MIRITETVAAHDGVARIVHFWDAKTIGEAVTFCRRNLDCSFENVNLLDDCFTIAESIEEQGEEVTRVVRIFPHHH